MPGDGRPAAAGASAQDAGAAADPRSLESAELLRLLRQDRLWLLRQIDAGRWPDWRLDLAALERELGLLLEQAEQRQGEG